MHLQILGFIFVLGNMCEAREVNEEREVHEASVYKYLALKMHNDIRKNHSANPLELSHELSHRAVQCAAEYAETADQYGNVPKLFCGQKYNKGENFARRYARRTANFSIEIALQYWHYMEAVYSYDNPESYFERLLNFNTDNFANIVWNSTTTFGCGVQTRRNYTYTVCLYGPQGVPRGEITDKIREDYKKNVKKPSGPYQEYALKLHNQLREKHSSQKMTLDYKLTKLAFNCANLYSKQGYVNYYCYNYFHVGENVYINPMKESRNSTMKNAIASWYSNESKYNYGNPGYNPDTYFFTTLVWKASTKLGCAVDFSRVIAVCVYDPPGGNYTTSAIEFKNNVKPSIKKG